jgi:serine/threonine protein kinase
VKPHARSARERFGRYTLISELSAGGNGAVHIGLKDGDRELCVLKRLRFGHSEPETARKRIQREAHVAAYLNHPNIAQILDAGFEGDTFYVATRYVAGEELAHLLDVVAAQGRRLPPGMAVRIGLDVLAGLEHAHDAVDSSGAPLHIVHRDLGPRNVMVGFDGVARIIDFGAALAKVDKFKTMPGVVVGTPRYLAPELVLGQPADRRVDLYATCVLLFEMLTGKTLVPPGPTMRVLGWIAIEKPPRLSEVEPEVPRDLDLVVSKGLAKDRSERWSNAAELIDALQAATSAISPHKEIGALVRGLFPESFQRSAVLEELGRSTFELPATAMTKTLDDFPVSEIFPESERPTDPPGPPPDDD